MSSGSIVNNGLISSTYSSIFYSGDGAGRITNTSTIQGSLSTYYNASAASAELTIDNSGDWLGSLGLTPGDDSVTNTGRIDGSVSLGSGADSLDSRYGFISGSISGGGGRDVIWAGAENDNIDGGAGADQIDGGGGINTVSYGSSAVGVNVNLVTGVATNGTAAGDRLAHIQNISGTLDDDVLSGDGRNNELNGVLGDDLLIGNGGADSFLMYGAGRFTIDGGSGNDLIQLLTIDSATYGFAFRAQNRIDGGTGYDTLELSNSGTVALGSNTIKNVERIVVEDGFNYDLTTANANVAAGKQLYVDAGALTGGHRLQFDGSAETDGKFRFDGGTGKDVFTGGSGNDVLAGHKGADTLKGGAGADLFDYDRVGESVFANHDRVSNFVAGTDTFQLDVAVTGIDAAVGGVVSSASDLQTLVSGQLQAHHAIVVNATGGSFSGHKFLIIDANATANYQVNQDYVIDVTGLSGVLTTGDFIA
jgi:Ca2+-binding RTX toxin-like protein